MHITFMLTVRPNWIRRSPSALTLGLLGVGLCLSAFADSFQAPATVRIENQQYQVAIAATPEEQERGLMHQTRLPERTGMLFPLEKSRQVAFWMKNTLIPLDMIFIQNNRVVQIIHSAQPCQEEPCAVYVSKGTVDAVLELPGGTAQKDRLRLGAPVELPHPVSTK